MTSPTASYKHYDTPLTPSQWHPLNRGLSTLLITRVFTDTHPMTALVYGGVSGAVNYGLHKIQEEAHPESISTGQSLFNSAVSWCTSGVAMNQTFKLTGKPYLRINGATAVGVAAGVELFNFGFNDSIKRL